MNPEVFCQEIITTLEIEIELFKNATAFDELFRYELRESIDHLIQTTQIIIDCLNPVQKKRV